MASPSSEIGKDRSHPIIRRLGGHVLIHGHLLHREDIEINNTAAANATTSARTRPCCSLTSVGRVLLRYISKAMDRRPTPSDTARNDSGIVCA